MIKFYNTLTRKKEEFKPLKDNEAGIYTCGPTVYLFAHIGNLRTYIFEDILKRALKYNGYKVKHVMNITDVGHLTSDADSGEDKMEKGAKRENKTVWEVAEFYTQTFKKDLQLLNIIEPDVWVKATDTIQEQIDLIKKLEEKGFTYTVKDGVYFDTSKLETYGRLWPNKMELKAGARVEMSENKKNESDFALWKFTPEGVKRQMEWDSPWGKGFPGWHTECVVMSIDNLGIPFDIHCGGIDHVLIHHTNEIAQAEAAYEKPMCNFWMHGEFLNLKEGKMAKSQGNIIILSDIVDKGFDPLSFRYLTFGAHYRTNLAFSWDSMAAAGNSLKSLQAKVRELKESGAEPENKFTGRAGDFAEKFLQAINDDLNMPQALAVLWDVQKDDHLTNGEKLGLLLDFDRILGLELDKVEQEDIPEQVQELAKQREEARVSKDWAKSDELRQKILDQGYQIEDTSEGYKIKPK